jgi:hypothetical protein
MPMETARKMGKRYFQEKRASLPACSVSMQDFAGFFDALLFDEPAGAAGDAEEQDQEEGCG